MRLKSPLIPRQDGSHSFNGIPVWSLLRIEWNVRTFVGGGGGRQKKKWNQKRKPETLRQDTRILPQGWTTSMSLSMKTGRRLKGLRAHSRAVHPGKLPPSSSSSSLDWNTRSTALRVLVCHHVRLTQTNQFNGLHLCVGHKYILHRRYSKGVQSLDDESFIHHLHQ